MKIAVLGAGAMGSIFGGHLAEAGEDVILLDIWREHVETINSRGLHITGVSGDRYIRVRATTDAEDVGKADLVILAVKAYNTKDAIARYSSIFTPDTILLTIQNGLIDIKMLEQLSGTSRVLVGVTGHGATMLGPGEVYHAGRGKTVVGDPRGGITEEVKHIVKILNKANLEAEASPDVQGVVWTKLMANVGINPVTALTRLRNGEIIENPGTRAIMEMAVREAYEVAKTLKIKLLVDDPVAYVIDIAKKTATNKSSMLQDVERQRPTEIDVINGAVVRIGKQVGVSVTVNEILTNLIKGLERSYLKK